VINSANEVLASLQADDLFMAKVGTYDFGSGLSETALVVLGSNQQVPGIKSISGVEVVISRVPDTSTRALIDGCLIRQKIWTIYLVQYEDSEPDQAVELADRLCTLAPGATYSQLGTGFSDMEGIDQIVVKIPAHAALLDLGPEA